MNCEDFNKIFHELADYKPMQATTRDAGVSHIALCADCAAKLAGARAVGTSLVVAAGAESEAAPIRIKEKLMSAFAALHQPESMKPRDVQRVPRLEIVQKAAVEMTVVDLSMRHRPRWWAAAGVAVGAVAAAILLAVVLPNWRKTSGPDSIPTFIESQAGLIEHSRTPQVFGYEPVDIRKPGVTVKSGPGRRRLMKQRRPEVELVKQTYVTVAQNTDEYLPLTYLAKSTAIDSGTIVRVELSRSALASLGLRMNLEDTGALVKAEVVIGDDGVAQAIRLVQ